MNKPKAAIVLAAGKGKRMKSDLPKVLHPIGGIPMIRILLNTLKDMDFDKIVIVIGHRGELVEQECRDFDVSFAWQREQLGTGHAVMMAGDMLADFKGTTVVLLGDVPFLSESTINHLLDIHHNTSAAATCLSAILTKPKGYGRIIRGQVKDSLQEIVEHKDATDQQRDINEINTGTFCFDNQMLFSSLKQIGKDNAQGEYYLTDCVKILHNKGLRVSVVPVDNPDEGLGVNDIDQLDDLARKFADRVR